MKEDMHIISYAIIINLCFLISGLGGFFTAWILFNYTQKITRRPGINIKDF